MDNAELKLSIFISERGYFFQNHVIFIGSNLNLWGSLHGYWIRMHWIRIPDPYSMWSCMSSKRHKECAHCTAALDLTRCPMQHITQLGFGLWSCGGKVVFGSGSLIHIRSGFKVPCGEPQYVLLCSCILVTEYSDFLFVYTFFPSFLHFIVLTAE